MKRDDFLNVHPIRIASGFKFYFGTMFGTAEANYKFINGEFVFEGKDGLISSVLNIDYAWEKALKGFNKQVSSMISRNPGRRRYWNFSMNTVVISKITVFGNDIEIEYRWCDGPPQLDVRTIKGLDGEEFTFPPHKSWRPACGRHILKKHDYQSKKRSVDVFMPDYPWCNENELEPFMYW